MENFNLSDFAMDFEFDFQSDFTANENKVIDEILTNRIDSDGIFDEMRENNSSFFEFLCDDTGAINNDFGMEEHLPQQQQQLEE